MTKKKTLKSKDISLRKSQTKKRVQINETVSTVVLEPSNNVGRTTTLIKKLLVKKKKKGKAKI